MFACVRNVELSGFYRFGANMDSGGQTKQKITCQRLRLTEAITAGRLYQTKIILEKISNVNYLDKQGLTPLLRAMMIEDVKHRTRTAMVRLLLHHKADVNLQDRQGKHALSWACEMNNLDLVKVLFEKSLQDIALAAQDNEGNTALMYAVKNNNVDMVRLLVNAMKKFSLSVDQRNREDRTAYYQAVQKGFNECASILSNVGKASQSIKVNPFLDFLETENNDFRDKVRVSSASGTQNCAKRGCTSVSRKYGVARQKTGTRLADGRTKSSGKKRGARRLKSRRVHSEVSDRHRNENTLNEISKTEKSKDPNGGKSQKNGNRVHNDQINEVVEKFTRRKSTCASDLSVEKDLKIMPEKITSTPDNQDGFLQLILDDSGSGISSGRRSKSISSAKGMPERYNRITPSINNFLAPQDRLLSRIGQYVSRDSGRNSTKPDPSYLAYLEWKASVDHSPNTLRSLLALRAEQKSEDSSYRRGYALAKYEPATDDVDEDRSAAVVSPASERSSKSESVRKLSVVAKTVGLSVYLSNKRKSGGNKKEQCK